MDPVIRGASVSDEPVLLQTGAPPSLRAPTGRAATPTPLRVALPPPAAPDPQEAEAALRRRIEAELQEAAVRAQQQAAEEGRRLGREEGRAAGFEQGLAEGREQGLEAFAERLDRLDALLGRLERKLGEDIAGHEDLMVELAFEAAAKLLGAAAVTRDGVLALVRQALAGLRDREQPVLRLAPRDLQLLADARAELSRQAGSPALEMIGDDRVELGGCLIETRGGGLDARLETQIARLRDVLLAARAQEVQG